MKPKKLGNGKITALYERLSRDDDLTGDSNSIAVRTSFILKMVLSSTSTEWMKMVSKK